MSKRFKEFEKWENTILDFYGKPESNTYTFARQRFRLEGWKAALKWALTQETDLQATELAYHIKEELNEVD